uniref:DNA2/NAM7 helicase-like C-terminal domain-containing protein n=2 Tax=Haemonchus contortus TaxID=6289 RepID=W6NTW4_HAECO
MCWYVSLQLRPKLLCEPILRETGVVVSTVDSAQGTERSIVILRTTRNQMERTAAASFFTDVKRLNVALSRAKDDSRRADRMGGAEGEDADGDSNTGVAPGTVERPSLTPSSLSLLDTLISPVIPRLCTSMSWICLVNAHTNIHKDCI